MEKNSCQNVCLMKRVKLEFMLKYDITVEVPKDWNSRSQHVSQIATLQLTALFKSIKKFQFKHKKW